MTIAFSRRQTLLAGVGAGLLATPFTPTLLDAAEKTSGEIKDEDIFRFALNLEYMEAEYYLRGTRGKGLDSADLGKSPGKVVGGEKVAFKNKVLKEFLEEVAENELAHVRFYRKALGAGSVDRPAIDFTAGFDAARQRGRARLEIQCLRE